MMTLNEYALLYDRFFRRYERKYERVISREIKKQIESYIRGDLSSVTADSITKEIAKLHIEVATAWARQSRNYTTLKQRDRFADYMYSLLRTYMIMDAMNTAEQITQTTIDYIKDLLYQSTILTWSLQFLRRELLRISYIRMRARLIARTEITYATNLGSYILATNGGMISATNEGRVLNKRWVSILDGRTRRDHRVLNGQVRELNEPFTVVNKFGVTVQMNYPGDRSLGAGADQICNCRCFMVYE